MTIASAPPAAEELFDLNRPGQRRDFDERAPRVPDDAAYPPGGAGVLRRRGDEGERPTDADAARGRARVQLEAGVGRHAKPDAARSGVDVPGTAGPAFYVDVAVRGAGVKTASRARDLDAARTGCDVNVSLGCLYKRYVAAAGARTRRAAD